MAAIFLLLIHRCLTSNKNSLEKFFVIGKLFEVPTTLILLIFNSYPPGARLSSLKIPIASIEASMEIFFKISSLIVFLTNTP